MEFVFYLALYVIVYSNYQNFLIKAQLLTSTVGRFRSSESRDLTLPSSASFVFSYSDIMSSAHVVCLCRLPMSYVLTCCSDTMHSYVSNTQHVS